MPYVLGFSLKSATLVQKTHGIKNNLNILIRRFYMKKHLFFLLITFFLFIVFINNQQAWGIECYPISAQGNKITMATRSARDSSVKVLIIIKPLEGAFNQDGSYRDEVWGTIFREEFRLKLYGNAKLNYYELTVDASEAKPDTWYLVKILVWKIRKVTYLKCKFIGGQFNSLSALQNSARLKAEKKELEMASLVKERDGVYVAYANGMVKDTKTGLEWKAGPDKDTDWNEARSWVQSLNLDGGGWRMPTTDELKTLYKKGAGNRNMVPLLKTTGWWVWSGETRGSSEAGYFTFHGSGRRDWNYRHYGSAYNGGRAFAVRSRNDG